MSTTLPTDAKRVFKHGHTYYCTPDGRVYCSDDSRDVSEIDCDRPIVIGAEGICVPICGGYKTPADPREAILVEKHFGLAVSIGGEIFVPKAKLTQVELRCIGFQVRISDARVELRNGNVAQADEALLRAFKEGGGEAAKADLGAAREEIAQLKAQLAAKEASS